MIDLAGKAALVTGGSRGIGRAIVVRLASQGADVAFSYKGNEAAARETSSAVEQLGRRALAVQADVRDPDGADALVKATLEAFGKVDILVNNAGITDPWRGTAEDADFGAVKDVLETNLFGAWRLAKAVIPLMRRNGYGRIVNLSSGMGQLSDMGGHSPGYRVSKTGLNALTRMLASELADENILVNSVCPGWVRTDMGGSGARRSLEEGADTPVWLATLPDGGPSGSFFRDREPIPW